MDADTTLTNLSFTKSAIYKSLKGFVPGYIKGPSNNPERMYNENTLVLITGGSGGLGYPIALSLAKKKVNVIIVDLLRPRFMDDMDEHIHFYKCDISSLKDIKNLRDQIINDFGYVSILINNAGITSIALLRETENEQIEKVIKINLIGAYMMTQIFLPDIMKNQYGAIVNISSILGIITPARLCPYGSSKAGVILLHESLKDYLIRKKCSTPNLGNIKTLLVCPGKIKTSMFEKIITPSKIIAPDINPTQLAEQITHALEQNGPDVILAPYYANIIPLFKKLEWPYVEILKKLSRMNQVTNV
ncbi:hypothetical protein Kpol_534p8 [Vanderwaltozyma polyspora DSM 70294]|uniref:Uncharacterized protein n=1 Tax=Vanderwaltozyma polyspora (strain ATCC 22028 / DSM 70294 / BCRC 21397 / CBS 2163 / NBRC 10782 / NRRL Y-8283 / UCD 57-17) TaxID=436907 RepID=A7TJI6_VANPO|nr:uncharacterized protein Kpol_534p8 [Vanderwaltozyma polyspora DSM 70294]EDO17529.1 hypothetical protein Kpol_534p8 [Vanderwaltozyma polyspora DSM 70294]